MSTAATRPFRQRPFARDWLRLLAATCVAAGLVGALPAAAQLPSLPGMTEQGNEPAGERAEEASEPAAPAAFPLNQLATQLENSRALVRRAREAARPHPETNGIARQAEAMRSSFEALGDPAALSDYGGRDLRSLEASRQRVEAMRRTIAQWQTTLSRRSGQLASISVAVRDNLESWRLTRERADEAIIADEVLRTIIDIERSLGEARQALAEQQESLLALQTQLSDWISSLDELAATLNEMLAQARGRLLHAELPPLWRAGLAMPDFAASRDAWVAEWESVRDFLVVHRGSAWTHLALLVFLLAGFAMLSRRVRGWVEQNPRLEQDLLIFRYPLASALLLAILAAPWLYPNAPQALNELFGLLMLLPLLRVMQLVVAPALRPAVYSVVTLYLLVRLSSLLSPGLEFQRYAVLILAIAAIVVIVRIFRPSGAGGRIDAGRWWSLARLAVRLSILVLAAAVLANIGGLASLSSLLTNGVVVSAFAAIVLFAGVVVARAMLLAVFQTRLMQRLNVVRWHEGTIDRWVMRVLPLAALIGWVAASARAFRIDTELGQGLRSVLFTSGRIGTIEISLGDILAFAIAIWLGLLVSRFIRFMLETDVFPRVTLPRGVAATISMLVNYSVIGVAIVFAVAAAGIQLDRLAIIVGALSVGIGFGLTNIINNFVSGLILAFERPVQSGDTVEFGAMFGKVSRIGVRSSTVRTFDGAEVIVPNANLISNEVTNWTLSDQRRRMEILVGVAYGTDPHKVLELLLKAARSDERILADPEPAALFLGFGDSSLDFSLRAWTDEFNDYLTIKSDLTLAVHDAIYAAGIEIPFPQRDLHLRSIDPQAVARIGPVAAPPVGDGGTDPAQQEDDAAGQQPGPPRTG